jgi:hypothetical protein
MGRTRIKVSAVRQVGHVGHSTRTVVIQGAKFVLKLMRADDHDAWANVEVIAIVMTPWGKQSGGYFNPAITTCFLSLGKRRITGYVVLRFGRNC